MKNPKLTLVVGVTFVTGMAAGIYLSRRKLSVIVSTHPIDPSSFQGMRGRVLASPRTAMDAMY